MLPLHDQPDSNLTATTHTVQTLDGIRLAPSGVACTLLLSNTTDGNSTNSTLSFKQLQYPPPPPAGPPLPPGNPIEILGTCGGRSNARMVVDNTTDPLRVGISTSTSTSSSFPALSEQFIPQHPSGSSDTIDPGEPCLLRSVATGRFCRLAQLSSNASLTGLLCDAQQASNATVLVYAGNGLRLLNGTALVPSGPNCALVTNGTGGAFCTGSNCSSVTLQPVDVPTTSPVTSATSTLTWPTQP